MSMSYEFYSVAAARNHLTLSSLEPKADFGIAVHSVAGKDPKITIGPVGNIEENERKNIRHETGFQMPPAGHIPSFMKQKR